MTKRTLRRRVLIREYDYVKIKTEALKNSLYDNAEFVPLNQEGLERIKVTEILRGKNNPLINISTSLDNPTSLVYSLKDYLYNKRYCQWKITTDHEGFLCVQPRSNLPASRMGMAIFEKYLVSRL